MTNLGSKVFATEGTLQPDSLSQVLCAPRLKTAWLEPSAFHGN